jgi:crotonobetainyl-CoA:carnitine CoA-transferase CaiB-like acyl-CoA transferase
VRQVGCAIKVDDLQPRYQAGPAVGADTEQILRDLLSMTDAEIADLRACHAI